ncbi:transporter substrate-binding domain-containing protein [Candidatus Pacearchaeota archaeon]|nr:transporter substrate-binding domain-containing protein [Candidatus Pacearchaeota archaeon]
MRKNILIIIGAMITIAIMIIFIYNNPDRELIIVGSEFYPDSYLNEAGEVDGVLVEVTRVILDKMKIPYNMNLDLTWEDAQQEVRGRNADIILSASHKESRENFLYYTEEQKNWRDKLPKTAQSLYAYTLFTNKKNEEKFGNFTEFKDLIGTNHRLGMIEEMSFVDEVIDLGLNFYSYKNGEDMIKAFYNDEIDLLIGINNDVYVFVANSGFSSDELVELKTLDTRVAFVLFSKESEKGWLKKVREDFYKEFSKMLKSGEYIEIIEREYADMKIPVPKGYYEM